ncbi:lipase 3-like [Anticarsia gemmatalis]|uniref:lipase 3-like n=1 Tax=Anticarsia gemmatalis TaxID=129554 RepID=UPI003F75E2E6
MIFGYANVFRCVIFIFCFGYVQNRRKIKSYESVDFSDRNSDIYLNSIQLIAKYGYTPEKYTVISRDGYLVDTYRIPSKGPPVLLVHGIGDSSDSWLVLGPTKSVAFQLSDLGYDVWLFNARGNKYSKGHIKNISSKKYWDFTYEEMGTQDLPAVIDFILRVTSRQKLSYVGFSQGTTIFLVMSSMRPEYNQKIKKAVLLAPVAWINHINYPFINIFAQNLNLLKTFFDSIGVYDLFSDNVLKNLYHAKVCQDGVPEHILCKLEYYISYGLRNISNLDLNKLPVVASHIPAGVSTKTFVHYFQSYNSKNFQRFDYGSKMNQNVYSSPQPPVYDLSLVTAPLYIFTSESDWFSTSNDVETLRSKLPNVVQFVKYNASLDFTHLEFIYGARVNPLINDNIKRILDNQV